MLWTKNRMFPRFLSTIALFVHTMSAESSDMFWSEPVFVVTFATSKDKRSQKLLQTVKNKQ